MGLRVQQRLDGAALVHGPVALSGLLEGQGEVEDLPGSICRFQIRSIRSSNSGRKPPHSYNVCCTKPATACKPTARPWKAPPTPTVTLSSGTSTTPPPRSSPPGRRWSVWTGRKRNSSASTKIMARSIALPATQRSRGPRLPRPGRQSDSLRCLRFGLQHRMGLRRHRSLGLGWDHPLAPAQGGFLLAIPILWTLGIILVVIGLILVVLGSVGNAIGGRWHYF